MNQFLCINNKSTNPYFNLALEEYLLKNYSDDIFMLWQNEPSIVVGKHQNTLSEINHQFIENNQIKVARRLSGGGTVYHDSGNLNFTYIMNGIQGKMVDFAKYTNDIIEVLIHLGVPVERNQRNDLTIEGKKISGNAEHIFKNRVIHHGTLLFNSDLDKLNEAIRIEAGKYKDRSVKSVRSNVTNISEYLNQDLDIDRLKGMLIDFVIKKYDNAELFEIKGSEYGFITKLENEKYKTWDWIYGYSPKFIVKKSYISDNKELKIELLIKKGIVEEIEYTGNILSNNDWMHLSDFLIGAKYDRNHLSQILLENPFIFKGLEFSNKEIIDLLF